MADRLPPPVIQLNPPGFLGLLGLKNGGVNPPNLSGVIAPGFEMSDWYLRGAQEIIQDTAVAIPNGAVAGFGGIVATVPQGQWWHVRHYNGMIATVAGDTVGTWALAYGYGGLPIQVSDPYPAVAAASQAWGWSPTPFWVPPGGTLGVLFSTNVIAGASIFQPRICLSRCTV